MSLCTKKGSKAYYYFSSTQTIWEYVSTGEYFEGEYDRRDLNDPILQATEDEAYLMFYKVKKELFIKDIERKKKKLKRQEESFKEFKNKFQYLEDKFPEEFI